MKILIIGSKDRYDKYDPDMPVKDRAEIVFADRGTPDEALIAAGAGAEVLFADAISPVSRHLTENLPRLKMIHSEGVAYDRIDLAAAKERGIYVCNTKGCNAGAVAEHTIFLMLGLLRNAVEGQEAVVSGQQIRMKERRMAEGIIELSECSVGLYGFGDIAKATAQRLAPFGCSVYYTARRRRDEKTEEEYGVRWLAPDDLVSTCDFISLHTDVNPGTKGMVDAAFLSKMKPEAMLVNTSRGELVDNRALREALLTGKIAGFAADTIAPEPVTADNPLVALPAETMKKVFYSPHLGGITAGTFRRAHRMMWENAARIAEGKEPVNQVF